MTLVYEQEPEEVGTHAIIIGAGYYSHLAGGDGPPLKGYEEVKQLTSPPVSAREFAEWIINGFHNTAKPLRSVELLYSEMPAAQYRGQAIEAATLTNIKLAFRRWWKRAALHSDNMTIFYFCGHGMASGVQLCLMPQDFGEDPDHITDSLIDFNRFHLGMEQCPARQQVYFVDACRKASSQLKNYLPPYGHALVSAKLSFPFPEARKSPTYFSTLADQEAYGNPGEASQFTGALIRALGGPGSTFGDDLDERIVSDQSLGAGIQFILSNKPDDADEQICESNHLTGILLHELGSAQIPAMVVVTCKPGAANLEANLSYDSGEGEICRHAKGPSRWHVDLSPGHYNFKAAFAADNPRFFSVEKRAQIQPPFRLIPLKVS